MTSAVLLYDADCGFCKWSLNGILAWDRAGRLRPVPIESDEGDRLLGGLDPVARHGSWHLVTEDGRLFSGGAAAAPLARLLPAGRPLATVFTAFPGLTERGYRFVAAHRNGWARLLRIDSSCEVRR